MESIYASYTTNETVTETETESSTSFYNNDSFVNGTVSTGNLWYLGIILIIN